MARSNWTKQYFAFTVIEVLVVVAIFAMLSTISLISIQRSKERSKTQSTLQLMTSSMEKIKGYVLGGRSFNDSLGAPAVARSYGVSIDFASNPNKFTIFADFPPSGAGAPDPTLVPNCYAGGGDPGCDPFFATGFPKRDSVIEENVFTNGRLFDSLKIRTAIGPQVFMDVDRVDIVYLVPSNETVMYYLDTASGAMVKFNGGIDVMMAVATINSNPPLASNAGEIYIYGGLVGGNLHTTPTN
ncbi:MAG: type II secretion system protein [Patescibacteria group bacterium]|jgi:type II secretory pathway pseudopilin PulG